MPSVNDKSIVTVSSGMGSPQSAIIIESVCPILASIEAMSRFIIPVFFIRTFSLPVKISEHLVWTAFRLVHRALKRTKLLLRLPLQLHPIDSPRRQVLRLMHRE